MILIVCPWFLYVMLSITVLLFRSDAANAEDCRLPSEAVIAHSGTELGADWSPQEKWIWTKTIAREDADFNSLYCKKLTSNEDNPSWSDPERPRYVSESFLIDILTHEQF